jgi:UDP-N-acetylmuramate dehydrogenase
MKMMARQQSSDKRLREIFEAEIFAGDVSVNEGMREHTTLRVGGPAELYATPRNMLSLKNLLVALKGEGIPWMPVGGGSNLLVSDEGIPGAVIWMGNLHHIETIEESGDEVRLYVEAGTPLQKLVNLAKAEGYRGIEGLVGIPGSVGGALRGNSGSFGQEIADVVESVTLSDGAGQLCTVGTDALGFGYRRSAISESAIVLSANVRLRKDDPEEVAKRATEFLGEKLKKQPVSQASAGCVFRNPPGSHAGRLIDEAGCKGMRKGDIEVSRLHANFFVNKGNGKASDFLALMEEVSERVSKDFRITLEPEIRIIGRFRSAGDR